MNKLKYKDIAPQRQQMLQLQNNLCGLCNEEIVDDAVLDHCHRSGELRMVLHRGCNALLGKIENNLPRNRISTRRLDAIARNLVDYIQTRHTDIIHPRHKVKTAKKPARRKANANTSS